MDKIMEEKLDTSTNTSPTDNKPAAETGDSRLLPILPMSEQAVGDRSLSSRQGDHASSVVTSTSPIADDAVINGQCSEILDATAIGIPFRLAIFDDEMVNEDGARRSNDQSLTNMFAVNC